MPLPAPRRVTLPAAERPAATPSRRSRSRCTTPARGPPSCCATASPSWRTRGGISSTRSSAAGFRVIAPDQRGYGGSDRPEPIRAYDIHHLTGDLVGLLDALGIERAVFAGPRLGRLRGLGDADAARASAWPA